MPNFLKKIPAVLVLLTPASQKVRREKMQGILKYTRFHGPWDVELAEEGPSISKLGTFTNWRPDGIITRGDTQTLASLIAHPEKIPTVFIDAEPSRCRRRMSVRQDLRQTSEAVADTYLRQGFEHFAYVGSIPSSYWSETRADAFERRLKQSGYPCAVYKPRSMSSWSSEQKSMAKWLRALPKPCGLFAAFDLRAKQVLNICLAADIRVPDEIAIIGADNDEAICENTVPTLSSVQSDFENGGYMAAELLDQLMRKKAKKPVSLTYGLKQIVLRQSTQRFHASNRQAAAALEFIRINACEGITVNDVAHHLNVSRRLAELRFREACDCSILKEIQNRRLERVCHFLRATNLPISEIGERCGYPTETYLTALFKARFGMTMRQYRQSR